jgi:predicted membrane protein
MAGSGDRIHNRYSTFQASPLFVIGWADCKATAVGMTMGAGFRGKNAKHQILISALPMHPRAGGPR